MLATRLPVIAGHRARPARKPAVVTDSDVHPAEFRGLTKLFCTSSMVVVMRDLPVLPRLEQASGWTVYAVPFFLKVVHPSRFFSNVTYLRKRWHRRAH